MSVTVYSRLDELLRQRGMTVSDLERRIDERLGVLVDPGSLDCLLRDAPMRQADLTVVGAIAAILGVEVGGLFVVQVVPIDAGTEENISDLNPRDSRRLSILFDQSSLSVDEQVEMKQLVAKSARHMHERRVRQYARLRDMPKGQARQEMESSFQEALAWIKDFASDPQQQRAVDERAARFKATLVE